MGAYGGFRSTVVAALSVLHMLQVAGASLVLAGEGTGPELLNTHITGPHIPGPQCFGPSDLAAISGERLIRKGDRRFDAPPGAATVLYPFEAVPVDLAGAIRSVALPPGKKLIALTFDLCEQPGEIAGYDGDIVDYLRSEGVRATFFASGKWMRSHERRAKQLMADPLFEVGNHAEAHRNLRLLNGATLEQEILGPQRAYETLRAELAATQCRVRNGALASEAASPRMRLFRFPFGACDARSLGRVNESGLLAIQWSLSTGDPSPAQSATTIAQAMLRARPGDIVILHANGRGHHTRHALPIAIPALRAKGFELVTVSELLSAGQPVIAQSCYDRRPGDTDRYDRLTISRAAKDRR